MFIIECSAQSSTMLEALYTNYFPLRSWPIIFSRRISRTWSSTTKKWCSTLTATLYYYCCCTTDVLLMYYCCTATNRVTTAAALIPQLVVSFRALERLLCVGLEIYKNCPKKTSTYSSVFQVMKYQLHRDSIAKQTHPKHTAKKYWLGEGGERMRMLYRVGACPLCSIPSRKTRRSRGEGLPAIYFEVHQYGTHSLVRMCK